MSENQKFSGFFRGDKMRTLARNGLNFIKIFPTKSRFSEILVFCKGKTYQIRNSDISENILRQTSGNTA